MDTLKDIKRILVDKELFGYILSGYAHTLFITFIAALIGLILGFIVAIIKILGKNNKKLIIPYTICEAYTTIIRGTPVALQLFIFVFGLFVVPGLNLKIYAIILCFGINSGAYVSESIRAGILSVDRGQMEAGRSMGLSKIKTMNKIILPQAIKNVIPAIGNELIALLKETSIISMVGSTVSTLSFDLNAASTTISYNISNFISPSLVAAVFYLITVCIIALLIKNFEKRYRKHDRDKEFI